MPNDQIPKISSFRLRHSFVIRHSGFVINEWVCMNKFKVTFKPSNKSVEVAKGETLLQAAADADVYINSVCGGDGICGKCRLIVKEGEVESLPTTLLERNEIRRGYVLACQAKPLSDLTVEVPPETAAVSEEAGLDEVSTRYRDIEPGPRRQVSFKHKPMVKKLHLQLPPPSLDDNLSDLDRLYRAIRKNSTITRMQTGLTIIKELPSILRKSDWDVTATVGLRANTNEVFQIEPKNTAAKNYGVAVDVGTTTVVGHLVDLNSGVTLEAEAVYNSQIKYGEDVIRRIIRAEEDGTEILSEAIRKDINDIITRTSSRAGVRLNDITAVICAGNTTMISFLLGLPPENIRREPYIPDATEFPPFRAAQIGIKINGRGLLYCIPGRAGFVGGDITAGVLISGMNRSDALSLFVDIGTNGEIVVGNKEWLLTCSCSAGPAFEGSGVTCGTRAGAGAIENFTITDRGRVEYKTISDIPPTGICGSGILEVVAELFRSGILGRDGRFDLSRKSKRLRESEEGIEFVIAPAKESATGKEIVITQADIDNLIRAKAAVYAGISVLLHAVKIPLEDLENIFISGGFGNYLNVRRAICIGLLPDLPSGKIHFIGNGSVRGARTILLSREAHAEAHKIANKMTYFELSTNNRFMEEFTSAQFLPHTNIERFPSCAAK